MRKLNHPHVISFEDLDEIVNLMKNVSDFDLTGYTKSSLKRRFQRIMELDNINFVDLKHAIVHAKGFKTYLIHKIMVNVTEMFRDPCFYNELSQSVIPYLKTFPHIKIWSAGCSSGEEVYSLAILLKEYNLYNRSFIYGTDVNSTIIETAKKGTYPLSKIKSYTHNFNLYNADQSLSKYYKTQYGLATICQEIRNNILFSTHNLATDAVFNEFQLITCRNVLIYFDPTLQERVLKLLYDSLSPFGFLCLGSKESLFNHEIKEKFRPISLEHSIYQKIK